MIASKNCRSWFLTAFLLVCFVPSAAPAVDVHLKKLRMPGMTTGIASDINESGWVVGRLWGSPTFQGFLYNGKSYRTIQPSGWTSTLATAINKRGQVVGYGNPGSGYNRGFLYDSSSNSYSPTAPGTWDASTLNDISDNGFIAGTVTEAAISKGLMYSWSGALNTILLPPGCTQSYALGVNNNGQAVGLANCGGSQKGFRYNNPGYTDIIPPGWTDSKAKKINNSGVILGDGTDGNGAVKCFLYRDGKYTELSPPGWETTVCHDFNERLDVIGRAWSSIFGTKTFIYRNGTYHFFNTDGYRITPLAINDSAMIAGRGRAQVSPTEDPLLVYLVHEPDLTAVGQDGPVTISPGGPHGLQGSMTAFSFKGWAADWWLIAQAPAGTYSYDVGSRGWRAGFFRSARLPLRDVGPVNLPSAGGMPGVYIYFLGADLKRNGAIDPRYMAYDVLTVIQR